MAEAVKKENWKLITLYREAVHQPDDKETDSRHHRQLTLTMDYFDALEVKSFSMKDSNIRAFFGQDIDEQLKDYDVAMHSIPLYWPDNNITRSVNDPFYQDILCEEPLCNQKKEKGAGYLCLIQVYITPEVLRRLDIYKGIEGKKMGEASRAYNLFFKDLHTAMEDYTRKCLYEAADDGSENCRDGSFSYCIYQSLSIGDYMIGIRCSKLDYVFQVMEAIRRRKFVHINDDNVDCDEKELKSLILYKTYTIVSINELVIPEETDTAKTLTSGNKFVLRAVLSNHYWNDEKEIEKKYPRDVFMYSSEFKRLHGRYNFSVELSEAAFWSLLPTIEEYKLNHKDVLKKKIELNEREKAICEFLKYLIEKDYISQLNERYVASGKFRSDEKVNGIIEEVQPFYGLKKRKGYFVSAISDELRILSKDLRVLEGGVKTLDTSRSTISYNMSLLRRMVNICTTINGYSDSRIYVVIIIRLIRATMNGIQEFLDYFEDTNDYGIIKHIDSELNSAIVDLYGFSSYILDNSLQSLQTPDYNLESHISIEKLMMSYSAFLQQVIYWYGETKFLKKIGGMQERYVTIMVPKASDNGLSTKAYFYRQVDERREEKEKLLVVNCPSLYTLTDFAGSLGRLLHELAHNLRYEERGKRNEVIVHFSAGLLLNQLAVDLVERIRTEVETLRDTVTIQKLLEKIFKDNFVDYIKISIPKYQDMKLLNLIKNIEQCYLKMVDAVYYLGTVKKYINKFARSSDSSILSRGDIEVLWDFYDRFFGGIGGSWEETGPEEEKKVMSLAKEQVEAWNRVIKLLDGLLFEAGRPREENQNKKDAYGLLDVLCSGLPDEYEDYEDFFIVCMRTAFFIRKLTKRVTETVNDYQDTPDGRKIARYLAMGYYFVSDDSSIDFMELAQNSLLRTSVDALAVWNEDLYMYREIASDLFMVKMLGLTPFGYLNFCTKYIPADGMLNRQFVSRMVMTIYSLNGGTSSKGTEKSYSMWQEIFHAMCRYIEGVIRDIHVDAERADQIRERLDDFAARMGYYAKLPVKPGGYMQKLADEWSQNLKWFYKKLADESAGQKLMHCVFLCRNFMQIADFYGTEVGEIEWSDELSADLVDGGRTLDDLHEELQKSPLWPYCKLIQCEFNEGTDKAVAGDVPLAENVTRFVLDMHYDMLFDSIDHFNDRQ